MRRLTALIVILACTCIGVPGGARADGLRVVVSVKPIHSLVAGVMLGVGEPALLVKGASSPHDYALKPSDALLLEQADLVFWVGKSFEASLAKPLGVLAEDDRSIALGGADGLVLLPPRQGGLWEASENGQADDDPMNSVFDGHVWLDPLNAKAMVVAVVAALSERDPAHSEIYRTNGAALQFRLNQLDSELSVQLAPVKDVPFIVFHDAFQYFERRYGLASIGAITVGPGQMPGAGRLQKIRKSIAEQGVRCVFREPNFEPTLVQVVTADSDARIGVLDPEGVAITAGPDLYFELMRGNAASVEKCLAGNG